MTVAEIREGYAQALERKRMLDRRQVADLLGIKAHTLAVWAVNGTGPRFIKVGRNVRYHLSDVEAWLAAQATGGSAA